MGSRRNQQKRSMLSENARLTVGDDNRMTTIDCFISDSFREING